MAEIKFIDKWTHTAKVIRVNFFFIPRCGHSSEVHEIVFPLCCCWINFFPQSSFLFSASLILKGKWRAPGPFFCSCFCSLIPWMLEERMEGGGSHIIMEKMSALLVRVSWRWALVRLYFRNLYRNGESCAGLSSTATVYMRARDVQK